jgi:multiple sugar transport system permease protein
MAAPLRPLVRHSRRWRPAQLAAYAALVVISLLFIAPLLWMVSTSLKTDAHAVAPHPSWLPPEPTLQGYLSVTQAANAPVLRWFLNSLLAAAGQALVVVATSALAAYALARLDFPGKRFVFGLVVGTLFIPPVIFLAPNFITVGWLGWLDSLWAVILPSSATAFGVFFLRQFFLSLPRELEEAALLDQANGFQIFWFVILPLSRPALSTLALLSFLTNWNDFLWPLYVLLNPDQLTLPAGLSQLQSSYTTHYPSIMAGAVIASIPVLLLFLVAQRQVIEGVSRSGMKG